MASEIPTDLTSSLNLLYPLQKSPFFANEEDIRPWRVVSQSHRDQPLLRMWDCRSGSQPTTGTLEARNPTQRLDTFHIRKAMLTIHIKHSDWRPTPFISFSTSWMASQEIANMRLRKRGKQTLTVVDPRVRTQKGLPILEVKSELERYGIDDPYHRNGQFDNDHYLCVWKVEQDEVVGHWRWDSLVCHSNWYEEIVAPAVLQHRFQASVKLSMRSPFDLSCLKEALPDGDQELDQGSDDKQDRHASDSHTHDSSRNKFVYWSDILATPEYEEKLRLLCHSVRELASQGYVVDQLSNSQLQSKLRCTVCGDRARMSKKHKIQQSVKNAVNNQSTDTGTGAGSSINQSMEISEWKCVYHTGTVVQKYFTCCQKHVSSTGCQGRSSHIFEQQNLQFEQFWRFHSTTEVLKTCPSFSEALKNRLSDSSSLRVVAVDCEMGTSKAGNSELIRLTAIDFFTAMPLIDSLVQPDVPMLHYNTRYSGITAAEMRKAVREKSCIFGRDNARKQLIQRIDSDTVVVMHGGHNDLTALRWTHPLVIDTFILAGYWPEMKSGRSLKALCSNLLDRTIQNGKGHDSREDALACRELVHYWTKKIPE